MCIKILKKIEEKRNSPYYFFKFLVFIKDILWTIYDYKNDYFIYPYLRYFFYRVTYLFNSERVENKLFLKELPLFLCINLKKEQARKKFMSEQFVNKKINYSFFDAIEVIKRSQKKAYSKLSEKELGCFLSHKHIWNYMVKKNIPSLIVCEDDIKIVGNKKSIFEALTNIPDDAEIFYLDIRENKINYLNKYHSKFLGKYLLGTSFYFITLSGAKKLLNFSRRINKPVDTYIGDLALRDKLKLYLSSKPLAIHLSADRRGLYSKFGSTIFP